MKDFDRAFCNLMVDGVDFTLKLEVRGNKSELLHCQVSSHHFRRPRGVEKRIEGKNNEEAENSPLKKSRDSV